VNVLKATSGSAHAHGLCKLYGSTLVNNMSTIPAKTCLQVVVKLYMVIRKYGNVKDVCFSLVTKSETVPFPTGGGLVLIRAFARLYKH
jgi:hypothetical protein